MAPHKMLKDLAYGALYASGATALALRIHRRHIPVLLYHGATDQDHPGVLNCERKHIAAAALDRQFAFLKDHFQVISLSRYAASLASGEPLPERCAVLTFDDGYANNHSVVLPLLRKHGLHATMYLATDFVAGQKPLWVDRLALAFEGAARGGWKDPVCSAVHELAAPADRIAAYLTVKKALKLLPDSQRVELVDRICGELLGSQAPEYPALFAPLAPAQIREMAGSGLVEFGAHGCRHAILTALPEADALQELSASKDIVEGLCGCRVDSFSYPNGDCDAKVTRLARQAGYANAVAGGLRLNRPDNTDPYAISRLALAEDDSKAVMAATLSGIRGHMIAWRGCRA
ncbi:MAG: polysaccharide deacetylase family protein [Elusimicrobiota bacterium]|jgi:peptidoglycan/xylan/chitin deacetylase (PgdA/CDA1 family)